MRIVLTNILFPITEDANMIACSFCFPYKKEDSTGLTFALLKQKVFEQWRVHQFVQSPFKTRILCKIGCLQDVIENEST